METEQHDQIVVASTGAVDLEQWSDEAMVEIGAALTALTADQRSWAQAIRDRLSRHGDLRRRRRRGRPEVVTTGPEDTEQFLRNAIDGLATLLPEKSARSLFSRRATRLIAGVAVANVVAFFLWPVNTSIGWIAIITVLYAAVIIDRIFLYARSLRPGSTDQISEDEAQALSDDQLPTFTILVPAYREPEVIQYLLRAIGGLNYPPEKLDVKLLLEADDEATIAAATAVEVGIAVDVVLVPAAQPRTKPKALNYGLHLAQGDIITIYDAEDVPDPLQLRRAAAVFLRHGDEVTCVQAQLSFSNVHQNIITKWFTLEYAVWFQFFLPGLVGSGAPVPLGGTSNHFRRNVLVELLAWDPFNVTEDADLGVRMHRRGHRTRVVQSTTYEEANSDFVNWMKQRSRWYKGYMQTWIVHMRHPTQLWRELGTAGMIRFNLFVGGTPLLALLNPVFWTLTILWFVDKPHFIREIFPAPVFYLGLACWALGNFVIAYLWVIATRLADRPDLLLSALLAPVYWVMMSVAAVKAAVQVVFTPSYWEKTTHGLQAHRRSQAPSPAHTEKPG